LHRLRMLTRSCHEPSPDGACAENKSPHPAPTCSTTCVSTTKSITSSVTTANTLGIMVAADNPKHIIGLKDLAAPNVRASMPNIETEGVAKQIQDSLRKAGSWVLAASILASSMAFIDGTAVNVALPALQSGLHATVSNVQWVIESYALLLASLLLVGGSLGDRFGRRIVFLVGVVVFAAASAWCGFAGSIDMLIVARGVQGVGAALLLPGSLSLITASFAERERGHAIGTWSGFTTLTAAIGPVFGGWLVEHASWRWVFFLNLPIALAVIVITVCSVPDRRQGRPPSLCATYLRSWIRGNIAPRPDGDCRPSDRRHPLLLS